MTVLDMIEQGAVLHLIGMGVLFIIMIIQLSAIGKGVMAKAAQERDIQPPAAVYKESNVAVIAAISAAVNEYRKNNK